MAAYEKPYLAWRQYRAGIAALRTSALLLLLLLLVLERKVVLDLMVDGHEGIGGTAGGITGRSTESRATAPRSR